MNGQKFLLLPIREVNRHAEKSGKEISGDFIQEQLSDKEAEEILKTARTNSSDYSLTDKYTLSELLAEFNGDIHGRFSSEKYYIYQLKTI